MVSLNTPWHRPTMARFSVLETDRHVVLIHAHLYYGVSKRTFRGHIGMLASPHRYLRKENDEHIGRPRLWPSLVFFSSKIKRDCLKKLFHFFVD